MSYNSASNYNHKTDAALRKIEGSNKDNINAINAKVSKVPQLVNDIDNEDIIDAPVFDVYPTRPATIDDYIKFKQLVKTAFDSYDYNHCEDFLKEVIVDGVECDVFKQDIPYLVMRASLAKKDDEIRANTFKLISKLLEAKEITAVHIQHSIANLYYRQAELSIDYADAVNKIDRYAEMFVNSGILSPAAVQTYVVLHTDDEMAAIKKAIKAVVNDYFDRVCIVMH
jgi:hypothetical protein